MKLKIHKRGAIIYVMILLACIAFASFYGGSLPYSLLYAFLLLLPLSIIYTILNYSFLRIYQEIEVHKLTRGETHKYRVLIENTGILPIHEMKIGLLKDRCNLYELEDGMEISLGAKKKQELFSGISCRYAGSYDIGVETIWLSDPFGIYTVRLNIPYTFRAIVKPQITDRANSVLEIENLFNSTGLKSKRIFEDIPGNDIRQYQKGDSLNQINWKVSAKQGQLMVRVPDMMEKRTVTMVLVAAETPDSKQDIDFLRMRDAFLEFIVSAAWNFGQQSVPVRLIYPSGQVKEMIVNSYDSFMEFYSIVADGIFYSSKKAYEDLHKLARERKDNTNESDTWIIVRENPQPGEEFCSIC